MAHQTTHNKGKQTDDYSPPMFIYAIVGVGSPLWLWDYAEIAMKITTKAVANTLREPHVTGVVGMGFIIHPLAVEGVRGGVTLCCAACLY